jgi:transcriptional regulator
MLGEKLLTEKQKIVLKLHSKGEDVAKISQKTGYSRNSIYYALKSGQNNVNKAIETIEFAVDNQILTMEHVSKLRAILNKLTKNKSPE